jgi:hypothetical protein
MLWIWKKKIKKLQQENAELKKTLKLLIAYLEDKKDNEGEYILKYVVGEAKSFI